MTVLMVTGGRDFGDRAFVFEVLDRVRTKCGCSELIHGGVKGVDTLAGHWAKARGIETRIFVPDYREKKAPLKRDIRMLEQKPDLLGAFPGRTDTAHTKRHAQLRGIETVLAMSVT